MWFHVAFGYEQSERTLNPHHLCGHAEPSGADALSGSESPKAKREVYSGYPAIATSPLRTPIQTR